MTDPQKHPEDSQHAGCLTVTNRPRGSGQIFEWRVYGTEYVPRYQVYAPGLVHVAECRTEELAALVCDALNAQPKKAAAASCSACGSGKFVWWVYDQRRYSSPADAVDYNAYLHPDAVCRGCNRTWPNNKLCREAGQKDAR